MTVAMAKYYMCKACKNVCAYDVTLICEQTCSDCMDRTPCAFSVVRIPCAECNRQFGRQACFDNHKQSTKKISLLTQAMLCYM